MDGSKLLVFCETKRGCDTVTRQLRQDGWPALAIHGDKSQQERDWVLAVRFPALHLQPPLPTADLIRVRRKDFEAAEQPHAACVCHCEHCCVV